MKELFILFLFMFLSFHLFAQGLITEPNEVIIYGEKVLNHLKNDSSQVGIISKRYRIKYPITMDDNFFNAFYETCDTNNILIMDSAIMTNTKTFKYFEDLYKSVSFGNIYCYRYDGQKLLNLEEIKELGYIDDNLVVIDPVSHTEKRITRKIPRPFYIVHSIALIEEWSIDKNGQIRMEVLGIAPLRRLYNDNTGDYQGVELLCWYIFE